MAATARLEVRLKAASKARLERAADLLDVPVSDFVRSAAEDRAEQVLQAHDATTRVPAAYFDDLLQALEQPARPHPVLANAFGRARRTVSQD